MNLFPTFRARLLASFAGLGLAAIAFADWQASRGAADALRLNTYERLTAIRETKRRVVERYFRDTVNHVLALSSDESTIQALEEMRATWTRMPALAPGSAAEENLRSFYRKEIAPAVATEMNADRLLADWFPADGRTRALQHAFLSANPHPVGSKDLLLSPEGLGPYGVIHARFHPTLHRYLTAFDFHDIFLLDARDGRIVYSVFKEVDLGMSVTQGAYRRTGLARAFERALAFDAPEQAAIEDYAPYLPSHLAPAAFLAAPIWRAGVKVGVLAIQLPLNHINEVMTGNRGWEGEGLGRTGQAYIVGPDHRLRSDIRYEIEQSPAFLDQLRQLGTPPDVVARIQRNQTAVLNLPLEPMTRTPGTGIGRDFRGAEVLRSHAPLAIPGLDWVLVAEMETSEAFAPIFKMRRNTLFTGIGVALLFLLAAWRLARSVTEPVRALAAGSVRLGRGDFNFRLPVNGSDELSQLAGSFNAMVGELQKTTVSRDDLDRANQQLRAKQRELESLASQLINAQEDERSRVARELHDDLSQRLAAVAIQCGVLKNSPALDEFQWRRELEQIHQSLSLIAADIHGLSRRLHSSILDELGLAAAVETECRQFFERGGPPVDLNLSGPLEAVSRPAQLTLYRIVQEGLRNMRKHAEATEVSIDLSANDHGTKLRLKDNGRGFDRTAPSFRRGLGLASMNERVRLLAGRISVDSMPGQGTTIHVWLPKESSDEDDTNTAG